jgi:hypothetical protein
METHFFDRSCYFHPGPAPYPAFDRTVFAHDRGQTVAGWSTPSALWAPEVLERLAAYNHDLRVIALLRHPAERAFSHYRMQVAAGRERLPFHQALALEPERLASGRDFGEPGAEFSYLSRGAYGGQIERLLTVFPASQVLFIESSALAAHHDRTVSAVFDFLGVGPPPRPVPAQRVRVGPPWSLDPPSRKALLRFYRDTVSRVEDLLRWNLPGWRR